MMKVAKVSCEKIWWWSSEFIEVRHYFLQSCFHVSLNFSINKFFQELWYTNTGISVPVASLPKINQSISWKGRVVKIQMRATSESIWPHCIVFEVVGFLACLTGWQSHNNQATVFPHLMHFLSKLLTWVEL